MPLTHTWRTQRPIANPTPWHWQQSLWRVEPVWPGSELFLDPGWGDEDDAYVTHAPRSLHNTVGDAVWGDFPVFDSGFQPWVFDEIANNILIED